MGLHYERFYRNNKHFSMLSAKEDALVWKFSNTIDSTIYIYLSTQ